MAVMFSAHSALRDVFFGLGCGFLLSSCVAQGPLSPVGKQGLLKVPPIRVISAHEVEISFPSNMPYGRRLTIAVSGDGVALKAREQATFDVLLPDFVTDAGVDRATLVVEATGTPAVTLNRAEASPVPCLGCAGIGKKRRAWSAVLGDSNEVLVGVQAQSEAVEIHGANGNLEMTSKGVDPVLIVHTRGSMGKKIGFTERERGGVELPAIEPLLPVSMRDTSIRPGGDGYYYMTGTTGSPDWWTVTADIQMWKSRDLKAWVPVITQPRVQADVWNVDRQGTWQKPILLRDGQPFRPVWAPEIHFLKGTYWIAYCIPRLGTGLLKSVSGKAEGPYVSAIKPDQPLTDGIDASLFEDDDGAVYFLWGGNNIARMKDDMSGLAEKPRFLSAGDRPFVGFEGISLFKQNGLYYLSGADFIAGEYHCFTATSKTLFGPYSPRYLSVPHGGHNNFFKDRYGRLWSTFFGNDLQSPFVEHPGLVPMRVDGKGRLRPDLSVPAR
jgi:xylan 1,4-beta-xylosidase